LTVLPPAKGTAARAAAPDARVKDLEKVWRVRCCLAATLFRSHLHRCLTVIHDSLWLRVSV
jgi:hypothetical protein